MSVLSFISRCTIEETKGEATEVRHDGCYCQQPRYTEVWHTACILYKDFVVDSNFGMVLSLVQARRYWGWRRPKWTPRSERKRLHGDGLSRSRRTWKSASDSMLVLALFFFFLFFFFCKKKFLQALLVAEISRGFKMPNIRRPALLKLCNAASFNCFEPGLSCNFSFSVHFFCWDKSFQNSNFF